MPLSDPANFIGFYTTADILRFSVELRRTKNVVYDTTAQELRGYATNGEAYPSILMSVGAAPVKLLQLIDTVGGLKLTNVAQVIEFDYEDIKDDYYGYDFGAAPGEIELLQSGLYKISVMITVASVDASQGARGNPQLHIDIDTGAGWVQQPDAMGGYIRENAAQSLSTSITGIGYFFFNAGDKFRITTYDSVPNEPNEETVPFSQRLLVEYVRANK